MAQKHPHNQLRNKSEGEFQIGCFKPQDLRQDHHQGNQKPHDRDHVCVDFSFHNEHLLLELLQIHAANAKIKPRTNRSSSKRQHPILSTLNALFPTLIYLGISTQTNYSTDSSGLQF